MTDKNIEYIVPIGTPYKAYTYNPSLEVEKPYTLYQEGHALRSAVYLQGDISEVVGTDAHRKLFIYFKLPAEAAPLAIFGVERRYVIERENGNYKYCMDPDTDVAPYWAKINKVNKK